MRCVQTPGGEAVALKQLGGGPRGMWRAPGILVVTDGGRGWPHLASGGQGPGNLLTTLGAQLPGQKTVGPRAWAPC